MALSRSTSTRTSSRIGEEDAPVRARPAPPPLSRFDGGTVQACGRDPGVLHRGLARTGFYASIAMVAALTFGGFPYAGIGGDRNGADVLGGAAATDLPAFSQTASADAEGPDDMSVPTLAMVEIASRIVAVEAGNRDAGRDLVDLVSAVAEECGSMKEGATCYLSGPGYSFDFGAGIYAVGTPDQTVPYIVEVLGRTVVESEEFVRAVDRAYEAMDRDLIEARLDADEATRYAMK